MHITRYTDYSLRVLIYAGLHRDRLVTIGEIARSFDISKNHLMKVVQELSNDSYLRAVRGKNGGLTLSGDASGFNLGTLVRHLERNRALVACMNGGSGCVIAQACDLKRIFAEAQEAFFRVLDGYTLADLLPVNQRPQLLQLLHVV